MDHRLAEIFGARLSATVPDRDVMRLVIMLDDDWVIDGDVARTLVEIADRIAARPHDLADQRVGECNGARRAADDPARTRLHPAVEPPPLAGSERAGSR